MAKLQVGRTSGMDNTDAVPESKIFADPAADEFPKKLVGLTFAGVPSEVFPASAWHLLDPRNSDQETEKRRAETEALLGPGRTSAARGGPRLDLGPDPIPTQNFDVDKAAAQRRDFRMDDFNADVAATSLAPDPLAQLRRQYVPPEWAARFASQARACTNGYVDGMKVVLNDKGEPVRFGDLVLTACPRHIAEAREQQALDANQAQMANIYRNLAPESATGTGLIVDPAHDDFAREQGIGSRGRKVF